MNERIVVRTAEHRYDVVLNTTDARWKAEVWLQATARKHHNGVKEIAVRRGDNYGRNCDLVSCLPSTNYPYTVVAAGEENSANESENYFLPRPSWDRITQID